MVETIKNLLKEKQNWRERERESIDLFCCGQLGRNRGGMEMK